MDSELHCVISNCRQIGQIAIRTISEHTVRYLETDIPVSWMVPRLSTAEVGIVRCMEPEFLLGS